MWPTASRLFPRFHDMDTSFGVPSHLAGMPDAPTATVHRQYTGSDKGGSRLEHSAGRVEHDQESGLGLAWRPTGPGVRPTSITPTPVYVGVECVSPVGSSAAFVDFGTLPGAPVAPDFGPFSVLLIFEDGRSIHQPTWPTVNVQLLRRQVSMTLQCPPDILFFVCYGAVLNMARKLSDPPVITSSTPIHVFFSLASARNALGFAAHNGKRTLPPHLLHHRRT